MMENNNERKIPFFVPTKYVYLENGYVRRYQLNIYQKIFVTLSHDKSCLLAKYIHLFEKIVIILNLAVYIISWQSNFLRKVHNCPNPVCTKKIYCQEFDICPPVVAREFLIIHILCTAFFGLYFLIQAITSITVPARIAEVLYPVPDEYLYAENQDKTSNSISSSNLSLSQDGKPKRRASLIADRITKTESGRANWNSIHELQSTIAIDPIYKWNVTLSRYLLKPRSIIQIITTVPMIITFIFCYNYYQPDLWYINVSRIVQLAELFKLQSYQRAIKVISNTILQTYKTFFFLYWFLMLLVMIFGAIVFALERGEFTVDETHPEGAYLRWNTERTEKEVSPFISLASAMWYALVSITTVGYGDVVPTSVAGRAIGAFLLLFSFICISLPITVLGEAFATAVDQYNIEKIKSRTQQSIDNHNNLSSYQSKVEEIIRESIIGRGGEDENFNPIRRTIINRLSRVPSTRYFMQGNNNFNYNHDDITNSNNGNSNNQQELERSQEYNQIVNRYLDQINSTTDEKIKERYQIELELFELNQKMIEVGEEYNKRMKLFFDHKFELHTKLQQLMMEYPPTSPIPNMKPKTNEHVSDNIHDENNEENNINNIPSKKIDFSKSSSLRNVFEICDD